MYPRETLPDTAGDNVNQTDALKTHRTTTVPAKTKNKNRTLRNVRKWRTGDNKFNRIFVFVSGFSFLTHVIFGGDFSRIPAITVRKQGKGDEKNESLNRGNFLNDDNYDRFDEGVHSFYLLTNRVRAATVNDPTFSFRY